MPATLISAQFVAMSSLQTPPPIPLTVPANATAAYAFWAGWWSTSEAALPTSAILGGQAADDIQAGPAAVSNATKAGAAVFYAPPIGAQNIQFTWPRAWEENPTLVVAYVMSGDAAVPMNYAVQGLAGTAVPTINLLTAINDLVLVDNANYQILPGAQPVPWVTTITGVNGNTSTRNSNRVATASSTSASGQNPNDPAIQGVAIGPAAAAGPVGVLGATEQRDIAAFSGAKTFFGTLAVTEARDNAALSGSIIPKFITGTLTATESLDGAAVVGDSSNPAAIVGSLSASEQRDTAAFSGAKTFFGTLAAVEVRDNAALSGSTIPKFITGTLGAVETVDVAAVAGDTFAPGQIVGALGAGEQRDVAAFSGAKTFFGTLVSTEVRDTAAFAGSTIAKFITGTLTATESRDVAAFTSELIEEGDVSNTIAMRDANMGIGISPEAAWKDGAPSWGRAGSNPETQFPHAIGQAPGTDNFANSGAARQARLLQAISNTAAGSDVIPGWYAYIDVVAGEWVWCVNRTAIVAEMDNPIGQGNLV